MFVYVYFRALCAKIRHINIDLQLLKHENIFWHTFNQY